MTASADRIRQSLSALVAIPSITGDERAVQDEVARQMADAGMRVERYETDPERLARDPAHPGSEMPRTELPVVAGYWDTGRLGPTLMLSGHVDVVPVGDPASWTSPPFEPVVRDGRLYGRGACDMKGGVVAALEAVRLVGSSGAELNGKVMVVTVPSEEDGGAGTLAAIRAGLVADMVVITEPTNLEVVVAHAGAITFVLDVPGKAAHAATRLEGVSALDKLTYLVDALRRDETERNGAESHPLMKELRLAYPTIIGKVNGGEWASTVLDRVVAEGRYGVRVGQSSDQAAEDLRRAITSAWEADDFLSRFPVRLEITGARFDSSEIAADHPLPESLAQAARRVTGTEPRRIGAPYGADMRLMINEGGMPCVMYGPGDVRMAHAADENVPLDEVETCARVLADWIVRILG